MPPLRAAIRARISTGFIAAGLLFSACAARDEFWDAGPPPEAGRVVILESGSSTLQADAEAILRAAFPDAQRLRVEQLVTAGPRLRQDSAVLLIPDMAALSAAQWAHLTNHIHRGGPTLFWGLDPAGGEPEGRLAMLRPNTEYFAFSAREIRGADGGMIQSAKPMIFQSPFPRPAEGRTRWIPLAEAREPSGPVRGWPAALMIEAPTGGPLRAWGWIAWAPDARVADAQQALLRRATRRLAERIWLLSAGIDRAALSSGEPIRAKIEAIAAQTTTPLRLSVEMENSDGVVTRRFAETIAFPFARAPLLQTSTSLVLGAAPRAITRAEDFRLRFQLSDQSGARRLDEHTQRVRMLPETEDPLNPADERLGVRGANFIIGRRPIALFGARFDPLLAGASGGALDIRRYDPVLAARELDSYKEAGFQLVEVAYEDPAQVPQLRHLLDLMRERQLWAILHLPPLSPWSPRANQAGEWISALRLSRAHRVFAFAADLTPPDGTPDGDTVMRRAWTAWIDEQYGGAAPAQRMLGEDTTTWIPAPDDVLDSNRSPAARRALARFFHDHISRQLRMSRRIVNSAADGVLFTAINGDRYPVAPDLHHVDFITRTLLRTEFPIATGRLEFLTAHARGASGGKAVLWRFSGMPSAYPPEPEETRQAVDVIQELGRSLSRARAAGLLYGAIGGGPRQPDGLDTGLVNPDTTWRPMGDAWRARIHDWRRAPLSAPAWRGRETDVWTEAGWSHWSERYSEDAKQGLVEELRPVGWGRATRDLPATGLGNAPREDPAPFEFVNAEWTAPPTGPGATPPRARIRQALQMELLNTGVAGWSPSVTGLVGTVWVRARSESGRTQFLAIRETAPGARATLIWTPADPGTWTLRAWLHPAGEFGEAVRIIVE